MPLNFAYNINMLIELPMKISVIFEYLNFKKISKKKIIAISNL